MATFHPTEPVPTGSASEAFSRNPAAICRRPLFSDGADVRQHVLAEQFQRFHQLVRMFRARGLERQIDDAGTATRWNWTNTAAWPDRNQLRFVGVRMRSKPIRGPCEIARKNSNARRCP